MNRRQALATVVGLVAAGTCQAEPRPATNRRLLIALSLCREVAKEVEAVYDRPCPVDHSDWEKASDERCTCYHASDGRHVWLAAKSFQERLDEQFVVPDLSPLRNVLDGVPEARLFACIQLVLRCARPVFKAHNEDCECGVCLAAELTEYHFEYLSDLIAGYPFADGGDVGKLLIDALDRM